MDLHMSGCCNRFNRLLLLLLLLHYYHYRRHHRLPPLSPSPPLNHTSRNLLRLTRIPTRTHTHKIVPMDFKPGSLEPNFIPFHFCLIGLIVFSLCIYSLRLRLLLLFSFSNLVRIENDSRTYESKSSESSERRGVFFVFVLVFASASAFGRVAWVKLVIT